MKGKKAYSIFSSLKQKHFKTGQNEESHLNTLDVFSLDQEMKFVI